MAVEEKHGLRNESLPMMFAFVIALVAAVTALTVWKFQPSSTFRPLSITSPIKLTNGSNDTPPRISPGTALQFSPVMLCSTLSDAVVGHVSITIVNEDSPPQTAVALYASVPYAITPKCSNPTPLSLKTPAPLQAGVWQLAITISVQDNGRSQILSAFSQPFVVTGAN